MLSTSDANLRESEMNPFWCILWQTMWNHAKKSMEEAKLSDSVFFQWDVRSSLNILHLILTSPDVLVWLFTQPSNKPIYQLHFTAMLSTLNWWSSFPQVLYPNKPNFIELVRLDGRYDLGHSGGGLRRRQLLPDMGHQPPPNPIRPRRITQIWVLNCTTSILICRYHTLD